MKKIYILISAAWISSLLLTSCKKALMKDDLQGSSAAEVYNDSLTTKYSIDYIYQQNQPAWFGNSGQYIGATVNPSNLSEEVYSDNPFVKGTVNIETIGDIGTSNANNNPYGKIRTINMFIRDVTAGSIENGAKNRFLAQALFWRAYRYFELVKVYGGVPLVLTPLDAVGADNKKAALVPRNTTTETFKQIVIDLDSAAKYLPTKWPQAADYGRITKGAAQAFKGRVLLYYASPEFNPTNDMARWQAANNANNDAVQTLSTNGYGLYPKWDYTLFTTEGGSAGGTPVNPEAVLVTEYNTSQTDQTKNTNGYTASAIPKGLATGTGSFQPTYDMVKAFPMADGKVGAASKYTYSDQYFFDNRDPRFYQTIAYNGCLWPILATPNYHLWTYNYYSNTGATATKSTENTASASGFYLRKGVDPNLTATTVQYSGTDWMEIRYAEVLLNQAETAAETGDLGKALDNLKAIRKRAGIEVGDGNYGLAANMNHDDMIKAIMYEREIELAFEGKRFWDLRRRKLLESTLNNKKRTGLSIILKNTGTGTDYILDSRDKTVGTTNAQLHDYYTTYFQIVPANIKNLDTYTIAFQPGDYFFGIPTNAINNNPALIQNNTWGGDFDPLQ